MFLHHSLYTLLTCLFRRTVSRPTKVAQVTLLLKKAGLDVSDPANYCPISKLSTISKIAELLCLARLLPHVSVSGRFNPLQSVYRKLHSTETALLKIMDDLHRIVDKKVPLS